jgi:molybdate transport system substrate-binding protein
MDPRFARIAIGNPKTVPAGRYADQAIRKEELTGTNRAPLVFGENVRQVLDYVVRGEADAGLVYATDVKLAGTDVDLGPVVDVKLHDPVLYEAAIVKGEGTRAREGVPRVPHLARGARDPRQERVRAAPK